MSIKVNPPLQIRIPEKFRNDPIIRNFFEQERTVLEQLRQITLGLNVFKLVTTVMGVTTKENQIIFCTNISPISITLDPIAKPGDQIHIKRKDGLVTITGTIDGATGVQLSAQYDSIHLIFDGVEWSTL